MVLAADTVAPPFMAALMDDDVVPFEIQGIEVENKSRSKNDVKNDAERESLGNSIFIDF